MVYFINNEEFDDFFWRYGIEFDRDDLVKLFIDFYFDVIVKDNFIVEVGYYFFLLKYCLFIGSFFCIKMNWKSYKK